MTTPKTEVEQILGGLDTHFRSIFGKSPIADVGLAQFAFSQMIEVLTAGESLEETINSLMSGLVNQALPQDYFQHFLKACAHCALAAHHYQSGNEIGAWQQVSSARIGSGIALALFISASEKKFRDKSKATHSGGMRGKRNFVIKKFVIDQWNLGGRKKPTPTGLAIASKFRKPYGNPELKLSDFGTGKLSLERLDKTFGGWISDEIERITKETDGYQVSG